MVEHHAKPLEDCAVLFVDDDRSMVNATTQWLMLSGCQVKSFADPVALLNHVKPGIEGIVVSDIRMPEMDGMQLLSLIKAKDKDLPVILITGHGDVPLAVEAMKAGAFEFLTKPFSPELLLERVCAAQAIRMKQLGEKATPEKAARPAPQKASPEPVRIHAEKDEGLSVRVEEYEKTMIEAALAKHEGRISDVMDELQIPRRTLNAKMAKYGIARRQ